MVKKIKLQPPHQKMSEKTVKVLLFFIAFLFLSLGLLSLPIIKKMNTQYSFSDFFPKNHTLLEQSQKVSQIFQLQQRSQFLVLIEKTQGDWLNKAEIEKLQNLTEKIRENDKVKVAFSVATIEGAVASQNELHVGPLLDSYPVSQWKSYMASNKLIYEQLVSADFKSVLVVVEPKDLSQNDIFSLRNELDRTAKKIMKSERVEIGGSPEVQKRFIETLGKELKLFVSLSFVVFGILFFIFISGWSSFTLAFSSLAFINLAILALLSLAKIPFTILLSTLPIIVSVSVISVMIHTMHRWAEVIHEYSQSASSFNFFQRRKASLQVLKEMWMPNLLGSLTTSLGFVALCSAKIPLIVQYGWVVGAAVFLSLILSQLFLYLFLSLVHPQLRKWSQQKSLWAIPVLRFKKVFVLGTGLACLGFAFFVVDMNFSSRLFDDLSAKEAARLSTEKIDRQFGGVVPYELVLSSPQKNFWKKPENLKKIHQSLEKLRRLEGVGSILVINDLLGPQLPKTSGQLAETLFLFSMAEVNPTVNFMTENAKNLRLAVRFHDVPSTKIFSSRDQMKKILKAEFSQSQIFFQEAGLGFLSHNINQEVSQGLVFGFWHSLVLITALLFFVFKSLRWALLACLPNLVPPLVLMGVMGFFETPIKPGVAIIFSIALGLAFNNTVYFLTRLKNLYDKNPKGLPVKRALLQEGNPCLFETLIMFSGFSIFLASNFHANQIFGVYMIVSIFAGAVGDLLFLPTLLAWFPKLLQTSKKKELLPLSFLPEPQASLNHERVELAKIASISILFFTIFAFSPHVKANIDASTVLEKVKKQIESKDDQATVIMKIIEANGEVKTRKIKLQTLRDEKFHALARIESPADIKGTAVLAEISKESENQWLYLPSTKQVRRVVQSKKAGGVLGSELTMEDLNSTAIKGASVKLIKSDAKFYQIEVIPSKGSSVYSRVLNYISASQFVPVRTEYFQGSKLVKSVDFSNYKKINGIFRAHTIKVKNQKNKRGTDLILSNIKVNKGLSKEDFSQNALKD